jgi:hypothetical protein
MPGEIVRRHAVEKVVDGGRGRSGRSFIDNDTRESRRHRNRHFDIQGHFLISTAGRRLVGTPLKPSIRTFISGTAPVCQLA